MSASLLARRLYGAWMDVARLATMIDPTDPASAREQIQFMSRLNSHYTWLGIADLNGKVLAVTYGMLAGATVGQRPWL
ncbi:hypothetical protein [Bradyrhizobium sp. USDA 10063]